MKGIVFTELVEMVEQKFSIELTERMIEEASLPSGGVYTSVGTYSHQELLSLVTQLSRLTEIPITDLVMAFGEYLFRRFSESYPGVFRGISDPLDFLESVEGHIHVEVKKLYSDARPPSVAATRTGPDTLRLQYISDRPLAAVAEALIRGCFVYFNSEVRIERVEEPDSHGCRCLFLIERVAGDLQDA
jgi:hypothetical protein